MLRRAVPCPVTRSLLYHLAEIKSHPHARRPAALVLFILTLVKDKYRYQFRQLAWTHLIVFFTVVPSSFFVPLIFEGLAWLFLPSALIIVNDIMAYLAGVRPTWLLHRRRCLLHSMQCSAGRTCMRLMLGSMP
jgi:CDP-diglyceride synthetase